MKSSPFTRVGWFYLPCSLAGAVLCFLAAGFCATVFVAVDRHSHSASDTLHGVYPYFATTFLLLDWIARRSSAVPGKSAGSTPAAGAPAGEPAPRPR